ncbi:MAG: DNA primase [bacterium]
MAQYSSADIVEKIRSSIDIYDLVKEYVPELKRAGRNFKANCPFHHEKTPSFLVSPDKGIFHCFGCGVGGDIFRFLMSIENIDFKEALIKLGQRSGIEVKQFSKSGDYKEHFESRKYFKALDEAKEFYHKRLLSSEGEKVRQYLIGRGIKPETIKKFGLGLAPYSGNGLLEWTARQGFSPEVLQKVGLAVYDQNRKRFRDYFWNRIMIPIVDSQGRTVAFGGRVIENGEPKFLNSPESVTFSKSKILYGLWNGSNSLRQKKTAILVEGYMDVMVLHQEGVDNAVATMGTALAQEQIKLLRRYVEYIVVAYDPDNAGRSASIRNAEILIDANYFPRIAELPGNMDADDYILKHGVAGFNKIIENASEIITFKLNVLLKSIEPRKIKDLSLAEKINLLKDLLATIKSVKDSVYQSESIKLIAERIMVDERAVYAQMHKSLKDNNKKSVKLSLPSTKLLNVEEEIIGLMLNHTDLISSSEISEKDFNEEHCRQLYDKMIRAHKVYLKHKEFVSHILSDLEPKAADWVTENLLADVEYKDDYENFYFRLVAELKKMRLREREQFLAGKVKRMLSGLDPKDDDTILQYQQVTQRLKGVNSKVSGVGSK